MSCEGLRQAMGNTAGLCWLSSMAPELERRKFRRERQVTEAQKDLTLAYLENI